MRAAALQRDRDMTSWYSSSSRRRIAARVKARIAVEQGSLGWDCYVGSDGRIIGMKTFGASATLKELQRKFGFEPERVVAASVCCALGADVVIAVNLNGDIIGRHETDNYERNAGNATGAPPEFMTRLVAQLPPALREQASAILPKLVSTTPTSPGFFAVLMTSINIMQDQITRARLAGEPPHVVLVPRLRHVGLMEFNRQPRQ
jgi:hypothetical protein